MTDPSLSENIFARMREQLPHDLPLPTPSVTEQTRRYLFMEAHAFSPDERLLVLVNITAQVIEK